MARVQLRDVLPGASFVDGRGQRWVRREDSPREPGVVWCELVATVDQPGRRDRWHADVLVEVDDG